MAYLRTALSLAVAGLVLAAPRIASACNQRKICINWVTEISDDGNGETHVLGEKIRARGTQVLLIPPPPEPPVGTFLDQDGCMTFATQFAFGHKLVVYAEAWVGFPTPVRIRARRQRVEDDPLDPPPIWLVDLHGMAPDDEVDVPIESDALDPLAPLMALGTEVIHRFSLLDVLPPSPATVELRFLDWMGNARCDCGPNLAAGVIKVGPDSFREKFLIAHEMGHWLQAKWDGNFGDYLEWFYSFPATDSGCQFGITPPVDLMNNVLDKTDAAFHGLRSAEWSTAAMREGFAHFIAAAVFNDAADGDATFRYYKDIDINMFPSYENFVDPAKDNLRVSLLGAPPCDPPPCDPSPAWGGENRWTESHCPNDWSVNEVSNGMDWMRFFWHFWTEPGAPPTLRQIAEFLDFVEDNDQAGHQYSIDHINAWPRLREAIDDSPVMSSFADEFDQANCDMGVYNANTCP